MIRPIALTCIRCGKAYPLQPLRFQCETCSGDAPSNLTVTYESGPMAESVEKAFSGPHTIWRHAYRMPVSPEQAVTMGEGGTPLVSLDRIAGKIGLERLYGKAEWANPTGSFKDRLASAAVSSARTIYGAKVIATSSSGNAGAAAAAYAARAGLACVVFCFGKTTPAMIAQMRAAGAAVALVAEKSHRWKLLGEGVERYGWFPTSPFFGPAVGSNPFGIEGYKSLAYELYEQFDGKVPDWLVLPVCYGDALYAAYKGFAELRELGLIGKLPRLVAAELFGSLAGAMESGSDRPSDMPKDRDTVAFSIGATQGTYQSLAALRSTKGCAVRVEDDALHLWHGEIARSEGIYLEASSAASVAAVADLAKRGIIRPQDSVVCLLTSSGLKDLTRVFDDDQPPPQVPADLDAALGMIEGHYGTSLR